MWVRGEKTEYHGFKFDSVKEQNFYQRFLEKYDNPNSEFIIKVHPSYPILDSWDLEPGLRMRGAGYKPDFTVEDKQNNLLHVIDVKNGFTSYAISDAVKLRFKLFARQYGIPVEAVVPRTRDFKVKIFGTTKKTVEHVFKDIDYDWRKAV